MFGTCIIFSKTNNMKINPTPSCLSLVLRAIENAVLPDVTSQSARATLGIITATLTDLLKRQGSSAELVGPTITILQVLTHGDFKFHNLLISGDNITASWTGSVQILVHRNKTSYTHNNWSRNTGPGINSCLTMPQMVGKKSDPKTLHSVRHTACSEL